MGGKGVVAPSHHFTQRYKGNAMCTDNLHQCQQCGNEFQGSPSKRNKYCSKSCYWDAMRGGKYNRGSSISRKCHHCDIEFKGRKERNRRNGEKSEKVFCSRACYDQSRADHINKTKVICNNCGNSITERNRSKRKFCSIDCRNQYKRPKPTSCVNCGTWFTAIKITRRATKIDIIATSNARTCSKDCHLQWISRNPERKAKISKAFSGSKHPNWQGGSHYGDKRGSGWIKIAERCRELYGHKCRLCGITQDESLTKGWGKLQVNHITPFHQHPNKTQANRQSNLEALCKSCHTHVDWQWRKENSVQYILDIFK